MNKQMKIGIALSGGGLQGFAHIGALKALEDLGINNINIYQEQVQEVL